MLLVVKPEGRVCPWTRVDGAIRWLGWCSVGTLAFSLIQGVRLDCGLLVPWAGVMGPRSLLPRLVLGFVQLEVTLTFSPAVGVLLAPMGPPTTPETRNWTELYPLTLRNFLRPVTPFWLEFPLSTWSIVQMRCDIGICENIIVIFEPGSRTGRIGLVWPFKTLALLVWFIVKPWLAALEMRVLSTQVRGTESRANRVHEPGS